MEQFRTRLDEKEMRDFEATAEEPPKRNRQKKLVNQVEAEIMVKLDEQCC